MKGKQRMYVSIESFNPNKKKQMFVLVKVMHHIIKLETGKKTVALK